MTSLSPAAAAATVTALVFLSYLSFYRVKASGKERIKGKEETKRKREEERKKENEMTAKKRKKGWERAGT